MPSRHVDEIAQRLFEMGLPGFAMMRIWMLICEDRAAEQARYDREFWGLVNG